MKYIRKVKQAGWSSDMHCPIEKRRPANEAAVYAVYILCSATLTAEKSSLLDERNSSFQKRRRAGALEYLPEQDVIEEKVLFVVVSILEKGWNFRDRIEADAGGITSGMYLICTVGIFPFPVGDHNRFGKHGVKEEIDSEEESKNIPVSALHHSATSIAQTDFLMQSASDFSSPERKIFSYQDFQLADFILV